MNRQLRIGVDTGGTFTDFIFYSHGRIWIRKIPSTPENPSLAILEGLKEVMDRESSFWIIHGTTVATNSLLEKKGGPIALITTAGFEDILECLVRPVLFPGQDYWLRSHDHCCL